MKRKIGVLVCGLLLGCSLVACKDNDNDTGDITVSFVQEGQSTIVKTIKSGETLTDIPLPVAKEGYQIVWDRADFSGLTQSITVNALETPNVYLITYKVDEGIDFDGVDFSVAYGSEFELDTPVLSGRTFAGWRIDGTKTVLESGTYLIAADVTLIPTWSVENDDEYSYMY